MLAFNHDGMSPGLVMAGIVQWDSTIMYLQNWKSSQAMQSSIIELTALHVFRFLDLYVFYGDHSWRQGTHGTESLSS